MDNRYLYDTFIAKLTQLEVSISKANVDQQQLDQIKKECTEIQSHIQEELQKLQKYEIKRINEKLSQLFTVISRIETGLGSRVFRFVGEPIPRNALSLNKSSEQELQPIDFSSNNTKPELGDLNGVKYTIRQESSFISNVANCIVTSSKGLSQIHFKFGHSNVLWLVANGPVFIEELKNSIIIVDCHQLRMRKVENCQIHGTVANNRFVIEECRELVVVTGEEDSGLFSVDDFSDPKRTARDRTGSVNIKFVRVKSNGDLALVSITEIHDGELSRADRGKLSSLLAGIE
ncbi:hypothetical protein CLIB1423_14S00188 [[Candida] railenensis]|uniref:Tubulin binding cofactor C-like domain-containing protein n=1 Tax=[Candida] railenensis TaxID=45579 RepID=A0A9P0QR73_9ASCO|nr:hypothetical protein CLIB1423_14S00188 [[Candida] railenensis]